MSTRILPYIFIVFFSSILNSQEKYTILNYNQLKFEEFKSKDGLKHHSITEVTQDSKGYMWLGTYNGIYKYDGYTFKIYKNTLQDKNTLIENNINVIQEDNSGNVWIGTNGGLCRYNREKDNFSRSIRIENSEEKTIIIKDRIFSIFQDSNNILWIGTNVGLYQLTKSLKGSNLFQIKHLTTNSTKNSIHSNIINSIVQDEKGNIWLGTSKGLNLLSYEDITNIKFDNYTKYLYGTEHLTNEYITRLSADYNGDVWIGTKNGLNKIVYDVDGSSYKIENYYHQKNDTNSLIGNEITTICPDKNRTVWIGTKSRGISRYNYQKNSFENYVKSDLNENSINSNEITRIYEDNNGVLWISAIAGFLNKLDLQKKRIVHLKKIPWNSNSLSDNIINVIYEDSKKGVWVGTVNGGLNEIISKNGRNEFIIYKHIPQDSISLISNNVFSFCEDNYGNYWAGTQNNGLNHIQTSNTKNSTHSAHSTIKTYKINDGKSNLPSNNITTLFNDSKGDIWMGSFDGNGLMRFTPNKFSEKSPDISQFKIDPNSVNSLSSNNVSYIFEDHENILWIGTYGGGLTKIIRDENNNPITYTHIKNDPKNTNSLSNDNVFSIHEDRACNLWIGTFGGGLNKIAFDEKSKSNPSIISYQTKDGLSSDELYGILEDQNHNLWISSNNGISKFNMDSEVFTNFNITDGLQDSNFRKLAYCKGNDGLMYFGGINGFNVFNPNNFRDNKIAPKIEIVDFKLFNKSVVIGEEILGKKILNKAISETSFIELNNDHKSFSLEFAALHYSSSNQNKYAHKLEGFDKDWIYTDATRRYASYSHLDAGNYTFKVKASNNDNLWSKNIKEINIKVLPPPWKSWWGYCFYFLLFVVLMLLFRKIIVQNEDYQIKLKIEKIEQEKIIEVNKMKLEFFTNISHEFKTPLTLILGPLQSIIKDTRKNKHIKESLELMERNVKHLFKLINQVMEFRQVESKDQRLNLSNDELVSFCKEKVNSFETFAKEKNINLTFNCNKQDFYSNFDWDILQKIIDNLLSNSIKYTPKDGIVTVLLKVPENVNISKINQFILFEVIDTGVGIPKNQLALIFNRFYKIDNKDRSSSMGSGIGLALTKSLVELNKGTIAVKSNEGSGSIFTVKLPIIQQGSNEVSNFTPRRDNPKNFASSELKSKEINLIKERAEGSAAETILVVEDNLDMQHYIKNALKSNYTIHQAFDGVQGFEIAQNKVPDIIISDVMMPNKDGIEFCKDIKSNLITNHIPMILLTARESIEHKIEGLEVGADAYISKPFHMEHLETRVRNLLEKRDLLKQKFTGKSIQFGSKLKGIRKSEKEFLEMTEKVIDKNLTNSQFSVPDLEKGVRLSRMQLYRKLKSIRGLSANEFIREFRIKKAAQLMQTTDLNITEILYEVGFTNRSYFTKCFKEFFGLAPRDYLKKTQE